MVGRVLLECVEDLLPDATTAPPVIATADGLPGTELLGQVAPGGAGPCDPEHPREDHAVVVIRATRVGFLRGKEVRDTFPAFIGEFEIAHVHVLNGGSTEMRSLLLCSSPAMTGLGHRLVAAAKG